MLIPFSSTPIQITVTQDDVTHKWTQVDVVNTSGQDVNCIVSFNNVKTIVLVPDGTNQSFNINVSLVQVTNFKGQLVWVPPFVYSIGFATA